MTGNDISFEVEFRCHFDNPEEAYKKLPFLRTCLQREVSFVTRFLGLALFKSGQLLRMSEAVHQGEVRNYLGWKGPDTGTFANIRQEIDEDITSGFVISEIMRRLGSNKEMRTPVAVAQELELLGYGQFMSFTGKQITGYNEQNDVNVKLMTCPELRWPLLLELEKTARTEREAVQREIELRELSDKLHLRSRLVKEEPPSLLYAKLFGHRNPPDRLSKI